MTGMSRSFKMLLEKRDRSVVDIKSHCVFQGSWVQLIINYTVTPALNGLFREYISNSMKMFDQSILWKLDRKLHLCM